MSVSGGRRPAAVEVARRAIYEIKTVVAMYPPLALPIARRRHGIPTSRDSDIVIEGFPRTGTSFAVAAFNMAQPEPLKVACHVHAPAQILAAVRWRVPAILVIREPEDTVLSFVIRNPHISLAQAIRGYRRFYEPLLPYRDRMVVAPFREVTTDLGTVISRVNERFSTRFSEFRHTHGNRERVFGEIDGDYRQRASGTALERMVARPSKFREKLKAELRAGYASAELARARKRAEEAFRGFVLGENAPRG